jgi:hypothetical protein
MVDLQQELTDFYIFSGDKHSYEEWENMFINLIMLKCGNYSMIPYDIFWSLESVDAIPKEYSLDLFLKCINLYANIAPTYSNILRKMLNEEPTDHKEKRINTIKKELSHYTDKNGYVKAYRGIFETPSTIEHKIRPNSFELKKANSFTLSWDIAYWFAVRKNPKSAKIISVKIPLERILFYTNERNEQEIMIKPISIKGDKLINIEENTVVYDEIMLNNIKTLINLKMA